jgi:hypothetical protein
VLVGASQASNVTTVIVVLRDLHATRALTVIKSTTTLVRGKGITFAGPNLFQVLRPPHGGVFQDSRAAIWTAAHWGVHATHVPTGMSRKTIFVQDEGTASVNPRILQVVRLAAGKRLQQQDSATNLSGRTRASW